ncbi:MAG: hypothetical protein ABSA53_19490 [Streptosporangiaceae bacterium]|jgi:hypothetical protein
MTTAPTVEHFPLPVSYLLVEGDPTQWGLSERIMTGLTDGDPVALAVATPLAGTLLLAPRRAGSLFVQQVPGGLTGWVPCVKLPAPALYLPRPAGVAPHSPWYTLAAGTDLGALQEDILAAMRDGALITVSASLGGSDGTLVLNGAELPFAVLADAELTTQPS